ncbi:Hypothetical_protein [Hexamita inflata]|uniref:Hypothetical_protein n=1 Tax=Hexamita inflata TaxID=28002 RepID=A0ABP1HT07_9EUKA
MKSTINNQFTTNRRNTTVVQNSTQTQYLFPDRSLRLKERIQQAEQYALNMQHSKLDWDKYKLNVQTKSKFKPNLLVDSIQNGAERQITQNSGVQVGTENVNVSTEVQTTGNEFNQFGIQQLKQLNNQSSQNEFNLESNNQHTNYQVYQVNQFEYINAETNGSQNLINDSKNNSDQINKKIDDFQISDLDPMQNKSVITPYQQVQVNNSPSQQSIKPKEKFDLSKVLDDMFFPQHFRLDSHKEQINSQNQHKSNIKSQKAQNNTEILSQMLNDNFFPSRLHQQNNDMSQTSNQESDSFEMQEYKPDIHLVLQQIQYSKTCNVTT